MAYWVDIGYDCSFYLLDTFKSAERKLRISTSISTFLVLKSLCNLQYYLIITLALYLLIHCNKKKSSLRTVSKLVTWYCSDDNLQMYGFPKIPFI